MRRILLITYPLALLLPLTASAQFGNTDAFTLSVNPQYPAPYSSATLSAVSSTLDLNTATMIVLVSGKEIYRGNVQPVALPLGGAGSIVGITVTMLVGGAPYTQTLTIQPQDVALVVEPVSSDPPLYQGKSLVPLEGDVRLVAMANLRDSKGRALDPATCSYAWTVDGAHIANSSGIGKDTILVASPLQYRSRAVSVAVQSSDGRMVGGAAVSLTPNEPSLRVYQNDPLLGIRYDHALSGDYSITDAEDTLYAAPFSFPSTTGAPFIEWFLNGSSAQTGTGITLRPAGSGQGTATLSLVASAGESTRATTNLSLIFGATSGGFNFFGL
jgi:hypothetical protein